MRIVVIGTRDAPADAPALAIYIVQLYTIFMAGKVIETFFSIGQAADLSEIGLPMLDYLCRQRILEPTGPRKRGRGRPRQYSFGDIVMLRVIAEMLRRGISPQRLKAALVALRRYHAEITPTSLPAAYLVTDGRKVFLRHDGTTIEALDERGQMAFAFIIELGSMRAKVTAAAAAKRIRIGAGR